MHGFIYVQNRLFLVVLLLYPCLVKEGWYEVVLPVNEMGGQITAVLLSLLCRTLSKHNIINRTPWSCGLIRHVLDREVEGSKLGLGLFFCSLEVSGKAIRLLLHLLRLRPGKTIRCPWPGHPSRLVKLFRLRLWLWWSILPSKADYFETNEEGLRTFDFMWKEKYCQRY